jgi:hypothetical protein
MRGAVTLQAIINHIADEADDFLAGALNRAQARAGIEETITAEYPALPPEERAEVVKAVMAILDEEGFFEHDPGEGGDDTNEDIGNDR